MPYTNSKTRDDGREVAHNDKFIIYVMGNKLTITIVIINHILGFHAQQSDRTIIEDNINATDLANAFFAYPSLNEKGVNSEMKLTFIIEFYVSLLHTPLGP